MFHRRRMACGKILTILVLSHSNSASKRFSVSMEKRRVGKYRAVNLLLVFLKTSE